MKPDDPAVEENLSELARAKTNGAALIKDFLRRLLTSAETVDIAVRWALVKALEQKIPQREIAKKQEDGLPYSLFPLFYCS